MSVAKSELDAHRKHIAELITRYQLNPDIRDIYVEGEWDCRFITWFLRRAGIHDVVTYDIDGVHITVDTLQKHGLIDTKKERVVALAKELDPYLKDNQVICIADRDYDTLLNKSHTSPLLLQTDFSCQEMYCVNDETLSKFFMLVAGRSLPDTNHLVDSLLTALAFFHLHRATNLSLGWGMQWVDFSKSCTIHEYSLSVNKAEFTSKYLSRNNRLKDSVEFSSKMSELSSRLSSMHLMHATKDDLIDLLVLFIKKLSNNNSLYRPDAVAPALSGCVEFATLRTFPMFKQLLVRLSRQSS